MCARKKTYRKLGNIRESRNGHKAETSRDESVSTTDQDKTDRQSKRPRLDEFKEEHLKIYGERLQLVHMMENGVPAKQAIERLQLTCTDRTARNYYRSYKDNGPEGLIDKRWLNHPEVTVLTEEVKKIALGWWMSRPAAGQRAIWKKVCEDCRERGIREPGETSVKQYLSDLDVGIKLFRQGKAGIREWEQQACPVTRIENTTYANELWQWDHSPLQIWVKVKVNGVWKPFRAHITAIIDADSRANPGYVVSTKYPDSWTIALALRRAILPKDGRNCKVCGIPKALESDRGSDFISHAVRAMLGDLGVDPLPDPPNYPNQKGKIEIFFRSLDSGCLRILPGHTQAVGITEGAAMKRVHELLTLQQLDKEIARWIDKDYHQREHSETERAPAEFWEETVLLRLPESVDKLNLLLLKYDKECTVRNTGIKFKLGGEKHRFWSPELAYYFKCKVRLRYNPDDMDSVLVYDAETGKFLCEAFDMLAENPRYDIEDIKRIRSQWRRGLVERTKIYMAEVYENDRHGAERAARKEARKIAEKLAAEEANDIDTGIKDEENANIQNHLDLFRQQDRGK